MGKAGGYYDLVVVVAGTIQGICRILGVKETIDRAGFMPKRGGIWEKSPELWNFNFEKSINGAIPPHTAYQVERAKFDNILLENA